MSLRVEIAKVAYVLSCSIRAWLRQLNEKMITPLHVDLMLYIEREDPKWLYREPSGKDS